MERHSVHQICLIVLTVLHVAVAKAQEVIATEKPRNLLELPKLEELQATRYRPLFAPSRRPPTLKAALEEPKPAVGAPVVATYELAGIVMGENVSIAILRNRATKEIERVHRGQTIGDWTLADVEPRFVVLQRADVTMRLQLFSEEKK